MRAVELPRDAGALLAEDLLRASKQLPSGAPAPLQVGRDPRVDVCEASRVGVPDALGQGHRPVDESPRPFAGGPTCDRPVARFVRDRPRHAVRLAGSQREQEMARLELAPRMVSTRPSPLATDQQVSMRMRSSAGISAAVRSRNPSPRSELRATQQRAKGGRPGA